MRNGVALVVVTVVLLGVAPYLPAVLTGYFRSDDFAYVRLYHAAGARELARAFVSDWSQGIWESEPAELRPIVAVSYRLDGWLWGLNATGYQLTNLLIHLLNVGLVFAIARRLCGGAAPALAAAAFFALAPSHAEAVCWIAARTDSVAAFFS